MKKNSLIMSFIFVFYSAIILAQGTQNILIVKVLVKNTIPEYFTIPPAIGIEKHISSPYKHGGKRMSNNPGGEFKLLKILNGKIDSLNCDSTFFVSFKLSENILSSTIKKGSVYVLYLIDSVLFLNAVYQIDIDDPWFGSKKYLCSMPSYKPYNNKVSNWIFKDTEVNVKTIKGRGRKEVLISSSDDSYSFIIVEFDAFKTKTKLQLFTDENEKIYDALEFFKGKRKVFIPLFNAKNKKLKIKVLSKKKKSKWKANIKYYTAKK